MEVYIEPAVIHGKLDCIKYLVEEARTPLTLGGNFAEKQHAAQKKSVDTLGSNVRRDASRRAKKSVNLLNTGLEPMTTGKKRVSFSF